MRQVSQVAYTSSVHALITQKIVTAIEKGAGSFNMPWHHFTNLPMNAATKQSYQGVNVVHLWVASQIADFTYPYWATYKQWQQLGAQVKRGEKGNFVVFYESREVESEGSTQPERRLICKTSSVFNAAQVEGWVPPQEKLKDKTLVLSHVDHFVQATGAKVQEDKGEAYYLPAVDCVYMPPRRLFNDSESRNATEGYYATLLHELVHWSGHPTRCNRDLKGRFGTEAYAMEELVAELGSAFLCAQLGLTPELRPDYAQYVGSWIKCLKYDPKAIFTASSMASKAVQWLNVAARPLQLQKEHSAALG
jgi:antirestriction protein ArdC